MQVQSMAIVDARAKSRSEAIAMRSSIALTTSAAENDLDNEVRPAFPKSD
jgi:hypothetical protein